MYVLPLAFTAQCVRPLASHQTFTFIPVQSPETQHGTILALGHMVGRYTRLRHSLGPEEEELIRGATQIIGTYRVWSLVCYNVTNLL